VGQRKPVNQTLGTRRCRDLDGRCVLATSAGIGRRRNALDHGEEVGDERTSSPSKVRGAQQEWAMGNGDVQELVAGAASKGGSRGGHWRRA